jgi:hypothetical protein
VPSDSADEHVRKIKEHFMAPPKGVQTGSLVALGCALFHTDQRHEVNSVLGHYTAHPLAMCTHPWKYGSRPLAPIDNKKPYASLIALSNKTIYCAIVCYITIRAKGK